MYFQKTIQKKISCFGIGLHSGDKVGLTLKPAPAGAGIVFRRLDKGGTEIHARGHYISSISLATSLNHDGVTIGTTEHILSAVYAMGIDNLFVELDAPEVPIMDGSSAPFIYLLNKAGLRSLPAMKKFKVVDFFESGMYEYDGSLAYVHLSEAQKILRINDSVTGIEIRVNDIYSAKIIAQKIGADLGFPYRARDWIQMNRNLFSALKLEKTVMFIILVLIVLVAAFNIASTLIMMVLG